MKIGWRGRGKEGGGKGEERGGKRGKADGVFFTRPPQQLYSSPPSRRLRMLDTEDQTCRQQKGPTISDHYHMHIYLQGPKCLTLWSRKGVLDIQGAKAT